MYLIEFYTNVYKFIIEFDHNDRIDTASLISILDYLIEKIEKSSQCNSSK